MMYCIPFFLLVWTTSCRFWGKSTTTPSSRDAFLHILRKGQLMSSVFGLLGSITMVALTFCYCSSFKKKSWFVVFYLMRKKEGAHEVLAFIILSSCLLSFLFDWGLIREC